MSLIGNCVCGTVRSGPDRTDDEDEPLEPQILSGPEGRQARCRGKLELDIGQRGERQVLGGREGGLFLRRLRAHAADGDAGGLESRPGGAEPATFECASRAAGDLRSREVGGNTGSAGCGVGEEDSRAGVGGDGVVIAAIGSP